MKIRDIINEEVDMSFWRKYDELYNPEAGEYAAKEERREKLLQKLADGNTPVFTKPLRKPQTKFSNKPNSDNMPSAGYKGNVDTKVKAGHISRETGEKLLNN